jgi:arabinogalactan endo-1,4-beta-galactosidase
MTRANSCFRRRLHMPTSIVRYLACLGMLLAVCAAHVNGAPFMAGADISSLPVHEDHGATYRDFGQTQVGNAIEILSNHGVNWYRLRLFVNPQFQNNFNGGADPFVAQDLAYTIELAQRVKQAGGNVLLDFHYSDTWADPGHQWKPDAWRSLTMPQLQQQVYDYTKQTIEAFKAANVTPGMVQIGNEIASGLLWNGEYLTPVNNSTVGGENTGYPWTGGTNDTGFDRLASLLSAGIKGARDGAGLGNEPKVMIHHDQGSDWGDTSYYFNKLLPRLQANGADIDVVGYSYYPIFHSGGITAVQQNLNNSAAAWGKPLVVVEAGFPFRNPTQAEQNLGWAVTEAGQQAYLQAVVDAVENVPNGLGQGVFWWYAEARPTTGLSVYQNGRYGLFDQNGNLNDAARVFEQFLPAAHGDYNADGAVDVADYVVWRETLDQSGVTLPADGNGNGQIDPGDYDVWRSNFGSVTGSGAGNSAFAAAPEPAALILLAVGQSALALRLRRRQIRRALC